jgi:hypothetical protein
MAEPSHIRRLRVVPGVLGQRTSREDAAETLSDLDGQAAAGRRAAALSRGWPDVEDTEPLRRLVRERARDWASNGGTRESLLGPSGALTLTIQAITRERAARVRYEGRQRAHDLEWLVTSSGVYSKAQVKESREHDERAHEIGERIDDLDDAIGRIEEAYGSLGRITAGRWKLRWMEWRRDKLRTRRATAAAERERSMRAATRAMTRAYEIVHGAQAALSALGELPQSVARSFACQVAEGQVLEEIAREGFAAGERERTNARKGPRLFDPDEEAESEGEGRNPR